MWNFIKLDAVYDDPTRLVNKTSPKSFIYFRVSYKALCSTAEIA